MAYPVCCLFLQEHTIFKFKSFSGVQSLVSRYMSSIKMFLCFVAVSGFCSNVGHFSQRCDNEHSVMQMKRCLKPDACCLLVVSSTLIETILSKDDSKRSLLLALVQKWISKEAFREKVWTFRISDPRMVHIRFFLQNTNQRFKYLWTNGNWYCVKDLVSFSSIFGFKYIANKVGTVYEVDTW